MMMVVPPSAISPISSSIAWAAGGSRLAVGSSRNSTCGCRAQARARAPELFALFAERAAQSFDLEDFLTEKVIALGPKNLERTIYEVSAKEILFIELYGGIFGLALGLLQYGVLKLVGDIALPLVGAVVGTVTNWLAIQMLFHPEEPRRYLGLFTYQGLFPRRQHEIAEKLGQVAARDIIVPAEVFSALADKLIPSALDEALIEQSEAVVRAQAPELMTMLDSMLPEESRASVRRALGEEVLAMAPEVRDQMVRAAEEHLDIHGLLHAKVAALSKSTFSGLIRGLFKQEELYLIIYGGLLGAAIGAVQLLLVSWAG